MAITTFVKILIFLAGLTILVKIIVFPFYRARRRELIFLGSSRTRFGINPAIVDRIAGTDSRCVEKSHFTPADGCALLKKIIRDYRPRTIVIEISDRGFFQKPFQVRPSLPWPPIARDVYSLVKRRKGVWRAWRRLFANICGRPRRTARKKTGYEVLKSQVRLNARTGFRGGTWTEGHVNKEQLACFYHILNTCRAKKIEVIFLSMPVHPANLLHRRDMQAAHDFFARIAASRNIAYWDLRLLSDKTIQLNDKKFADCSHLNVNGAKAFSKYIGQRLLAHKNAQKPPGDHCADFKTRMQEIKGIAGVVLKVVPAESPYTYAVSGTALRSDPGFRVEYCFAARNEQKELIWSREYSSEPTADFIAPGHGNFKISVYTRKPESKQNYDAMQRISINVP